MKDTKCCPESDCCKIPVCLEFVGVSATDDFIEQMTSLFSGIFADLCGNGSEEMITICHKPGTPAENTLVIPTSALQGHLDHGDTIGACPVETP